MAKRNKRRARELSEYTQHSVYFPGAPRILTPEQDRNVCERLRMTIDGKVSTATAGAKNVDADGREVEP